MPLGAVLLLAVCANMPISHSPFGLWRLVLHTCYYYVRYYVRYYVLLLCYTCSLKAAQVLFALFAFCGCLGPGAWSLET